VNNVSLWERAATDGTKAAQWNNDRTQRAGEVLALCGTAMAVAAVCIPGGWGVAGVTLATSLGILKDSLGATAGTFKDAGDANIDSLRDTICSQITVTADACRRKELEFANNFYYNVVAFRQDLQNAGQSDDLKAEIWHRMFAASTAKIPVDSKQGLQDFTKQSIEQLFCVADQYYHDYFRTCQELAANNVPDKGGLGTFTLPQRQLDETLRLIKIGFAGHLRKQPAYQNWKRLFMNQWVSSGIQI